MLFEALKLVLDPYVLWVILGSAMFGLFVGAVPGLTATMATDAPVSRVNPSSTSRTASFSSSASEIAKVSATSASGPPRPRSASGRWHPQVATSTAKAAPARPTARVRRLHRGMLEPLPVDRSALEGPGERARPEVALQDGRGLVVFVPTKEAP